MKKFFGLILFMGLSVQLPALLNGLHWYSDTADSAVSGDDYIVSAYARIVGDPPPSIWLDFFKNGAYVTSSSGYPGGADFSMSGIGGTQNDTVDPENINWEDYITYEVDAYYEGDYSSQEYIYHSVRVYRPDSTPPSTPTSLSASSIGFSSLNLNWSASTDNHAVAYYEIKFSYEVFYEVWGEWASYWEEWTTATSDTSITVSGLTLGTGYDISVRAVDPADNRSDWSTSIWVTTSTDDQLPTVPSGVGGSGIANTAFTLSWTASTDNVGVAAYEVFKGGVSYGTTTGTSLSITGLMPGTIYAMRVRARDAAFNWSAQSTAVNVTTTANATADFDSDDVPDVVEQQLGTNIFSAKADDLGNANALKIHRPNQ